MARVSSRIDEDEVDMAIGDKPMLYPWRCNMHLQVICLVDVETEKLLTLLCEREEQEDLASNLQLVAEERQSKETKHCFGKWCDLWKFEIFLDWNEYEWYPNIFQLIFFFF